MSNWGPHPQAILLLGPTGAGKTPLGELLDRQGLGGRRCLHFDFGAQLRRMAAGQFDRDAFSDVEIDFVRLVLIANALLEDEHFALAARILQAFLKQRNAAPGDLLVLNGLPRHAGQARDIETIAEVAAVVELSARPETILRRIQADPAGDRAGREDDDLDSVTNRLRIYAERTTALLAYYRTRGVPVFRIEVGKATTAEEVLAVLSEKANIQ